MSSKDSQDFIRAYPDAIKVITDEKLYFSLLDDPTLEPIIVILREGPMTLEELSERYNEYVENKIKTNARHLRIPSTKKELKNLLVEICYPEDELKELLEKEKLTQTDEQNIEAQYIKCKLPKDKKSETTVYRYIKKLEEEGIVFESGRRIDPDGRTTKALFSRTAKLFIPATVSKEWWETPSSKRIIEATAKMFGLAMGKKKPDVECIKQFMLNMDTDTSQKSAEFYTTHNIELTEITKEMGFKEIDKALNWLNYLLLIQHAEEYLEKLKKCFKD
ncbi:MAG: hypothetical protein ACFFDS_04485 [Candidatus Thorarchaeota archaeon]